MTNPIRRAVMLGPILAVPVLALPGCATSGLGRSVEEGLRRLLTIADQRGLTRLVAQNGYLDDSVARFACRR